MTEEKITLEQFVEEFDQVNDDSGVYLSIDASAILATYYVKKETLGVEVLPYKENNALRFNIHKGGEDITLGVVDIVDCEKDMAEEDSSYSFVNKKRDVVMYICFSEKF